MTDWKEHLQRAIRLKGSQARLAMALGCSQAKISWLLISKEEIAPADAIGIHRATAGEVSAHALRPDLFPEGFEPPVQRAIA